jgi:hypothetical protein
MKRLAGWERCCRNSPCNADIETNKIPTYASSVVKSCRISLLHMSRNVKNGTERKMYYNTKWSQLKCEVWLLNDKTECIAPDLKPFIAKVNI